MGGAVRMSPEELRRVRWKGRGAYRALSYYFTVRWNQPELGRYIRHVLGPFSVAPDPGRSRNPPTPGLPPTYSVADLGPGRVGRYSVLYGEDVMLAAETEAEALQYLFRHINVESCWQTGDLLLIHAGAAVTRHGEGVVLPGASGSGKTTLVAGLLRSGFAYLSDEAGAIDPVTRRLFPYQRTLCLKEGTFELFSEFEGRAGTLPPLRGEWYVRPETLGPAPSAEPCHVRYVIAPRYKKGSDVQLASISRAEAVAVLWDALWNRATYGERALHLLTEVMTGADGFRMTYDSLDGAVEAVRTLTRS